MSQQQRVRYACPSCKSVEHLETIERVTLHAEVEIFRTAEGPEFAHNGEYDVLSEEATVVGIRCAECEWEFIDYSEDDWIDQLIVSGEN